MKKYKGAQKGLKEDKTANTCFTQDREEKQTQSETVDRCFYLYWRPEIKTVGHWHTVVTLIHEGFLVETHSRGVRVCLPPSRNGNHTDSLQPFDDNKADNADSATALKRIAGSYRR